MVEELLGKEVQQLPGAVVQGRLTPDSWLNLGSRCSSKDLHPHTFFAPSSFLHWLRQSHQSCKQPSTPRLRRTNLI